jgi:hypothetical protein
MTWSRIAWFAHWAESMRGSPPAPCAPSSPAPTKIRYRKPDFFGLQLPIANGYRRPLVNPVGRYVLVSISSLTRFERLCRDGMGSVEIKLTPRPWWAQA